jgi:ornithine decarboxylase
MLANLEPVVINSQDAIAKLSRATPSPDVAVEDKSVKAVAGEILSSKLSQKSETDQESPFFVGDIGDVFRQHLLWKSLLPRIEPFYGTVMFIFFCKF